MSEKRHILPMSSLALFLTGVLALLVWQNTLGIAGSENLKSLLLPTEGSSASIEYHFVYLPRLVMTILAGAGLGLTGAVFQQALNNPLASPATLGVSSGAQLALALGLLIAAQVHADHAFLLSLGGSFLAWLLVTLLAGRGISDPIRLILTGMIVSFTLGALTTCLFLLKNQYLTSLFLWGAGDLAQQGWDGVSFLLPRVLAGAAAIFLLSRPLALLGLGADMAHSAGLRVSVFRLVLLSAAIFLSAAVTAAVGLIAFVGLAAPHLARFLGARRTLSCLVVASGVGAMLLLFVDQSVQFAAGHLSAFLPAGALTGLLGAPLLLFLMRRVPAQPAASHEGQASLRASVAGQQSQRRVLAVLSGLLVVILVVSVAVPAMPVEVLLEWRLPRIMAAVLAGCSLGLAGCMIQRILANPMASPEVIGISTGAGMGLIVTMLVAPMVANAGQTVGALCGAFVVLALVLAYGARGNVDPRRIILVGIAITALADAIILIFLATGDPRGNVLLAFMSGSTYRVTMADLPLPALMSGFGLLLILPVLRWLEILPLGDTIGRAVGMPLALARLMVISSVALLTASACMFVGPISFVGLTAPHIARLLGLRRAGSQLAGAGLLGALVVVLSDVVGRNLFQPYELPAGLVTIFLGAFVFLMIVGIQRALDAEPGLGWKKMMLKRA